MDKSDQMMIETVLKDELSRGDFALSGVAPILSHMLSNSGVPMVSENIIARLRGMLADISRQLVNHACNQCLVATMPQEKRDQAKLAFAQSLVEDTAILSHCFSLAMEAYLCEHLEKRASLDPVLSPLLQELIAASSPQVSELAMAVLAAQSRFIQSQRRMGHQISELPAELFHRALLRWQEWDGPFSREVRNQTAAHFRSSYDEAGSRLGLMARLVATMRGGARAALELEHGGLALFATALGALTGQQRELSVLSCHERQSARLALSLRGAGMIASEIERQFQFLHPAQTLPVDLDALLPDRAQALINNTQFQAAR